MELRCIIFSNLKQKKYVSTDNIIYYFYKMIQHFIMLLRLNSPTGFMFLYLPCVFGLLLNATHANNLLYHMAIFLLGSIIMRSSGCIINDICDRNIDKQVLRTQNRPISSGAISVRCGVIICCVLSLIGLCILLSLPRVSVCIGFLAVPLVLLYPIMKRHTYFPQLFLGFTINIGVLISSSSVKHYIGIYDIVLYLGCVVWTMGYDTVYGFMDYKDDIKINVRSMSLFLFLNHRLYIKNYITCLYLTFYTLFTTTMLLGNEFMQGIQKFIFCVLCATCCCAEVVEISNFDYNAPKSCLQKFKNSAMSLSVVSVYLVFVFYISR